MGNADNVYISDGLIDRRITSSPTDFKPSTLPRHLLFDHQFSQHFVPLPSHNRSIIMDLVFVCELDGFQHGSGPFILKGAVLIPVQGGTPHTYSFQTDFLEELPAAQQTFRYATRNFHGLPMNLPGITYDSRGDAITSYIKQRVYRFQERTGDYSASQPNVYVLRKGG
ncbi:hypothetical protein ACROYT_G015982 [Oculina patagonica]